MSDKFYSRATGKLTKSSYGSFTEIKKSKKNTSTIYSIDDEDEDSGQYPFEILSRTQVKYIQQFVRSITGDESIQIDPSIRGIHLIGIWYAPIDNVTITCTLLQPHITNCVVSPRMSSYLAAKRHCEEYFIARDKGHPEIKSTNTSYQLLGKYSIPFMDSLIEHNIVSERSVHWSNVIIAQTQPIFVVVSSEGTLECSLTYNSCLVLDEYSPSTVNITHPTTDTLNFAFRSSKVADRDGEGGFMTVHGSGVIQCQGNPKYIKETMESFRECILCAMKPDSIRKLINSLNVVRRI